MIGKTLGHYHILEKIGQGGMGEVYLAHDTSLQRKVALKFLPPETTQEDSFAHRRFMREAETAAALDHPYICHINEVCEAEGKDFIVMEYVEGQTLKERLAEEPLALEDAHRIAIEILEALEKAHEKGIVHRDLKPANVMIASEGHVKVMDFGLAKQLILRSESETQEETLSTVSQSGIISGTLAYMSPEQLQGKPVDARSDLFSFGIVFYEMLTGVHPFRRQAVIETASAILTEAPQALEHHRPGIPNHLQEVVDKLLAKNPLQRYQSVRDILADLREVTLTSEEMPIRERANAYPVALPRILGRRRFRRGLATTAAVFAVAVLVAAIMWLRREPTPTSMDTGLIRIAVLPFEYLGMTEDAYFADGITEDVRGKLASLPQLTVIARGSSMSYKGTGKSPQTIAKELEVGYLLSGTVRWQKGVSGSISRIRVAPELVEVSGKGTPTIRWQDSYDAVVEDVFHVQAEIAARVAGALRATLGAQERRLLEGQPTTNMSAYDAYLRAESLWRSGGVDAPALQRVVPHFELAVSLDPSFALAWAHLSIVRSHLYYNGAPSQALKESARSAAERALQLSPSLPDALLAMGDYLLGVERDNPRALNLFNQGLVVDAKSADLLSGAAQAEISLGRWEQAIAHLERARSIDPRSMHTSIQFASSLVWMRRYPQALEASNHTLALSPRNPWAIQVKAMVFLGQGDLKAARAFIAKQPSENEPAILVNLGQYWDLMWVLDDGQRRRLLQLPLEAFGGYRAARALTFAQTHMLLGNTLELRRNSEEAEQDFASQLRETPDDAQLHVMRGLTLAYLGRRDEAIREGEQGVALLPISREAYTGPYLQHQLVRIYLILGEREKALDLLESLLKIPYYLSPAWLSIDPNFAPLRGHPRFEKLLSAKD